MAVVRNDSARPAFRVLAAILAVPMGIVAAGCLHEAVAGAGGWAWLLSLFATTFAAAAEFTFIAASGKAPPWFLAKFALRDPDEDR